ncbi:MAG: NHLP family bacteriocin export ABC transporter peptidase/permease/ATPase subunit [Elainellaceae cyanobacterium]
MFIRPLQLFKRAPGHRVKTPTVLQMEAVECGAAALSIVMGYYGKTVPLVELRQACGVSRDGVTAANVLKAARRYNMAAKGYKKPLEALFDLAPPFIVFWHFNHFLVVEGFGKDKVYLNDPAQGPRTVTAEEFDEGYTGIVLMLEPGEDFEPGGEKPSAIAALRRRLRGSTGALAYCVAAGFLLVIPNLALPAFSQIFVDKVLVGGKGEWLPYILGTMLVIVVVQGMLTLLQLRFLRALKIKLAVVLSSQFVWHLLRLPVSFYAQRFAGEISSRIRLNDSVASVLSGRLTLTAINLVVLVFYGVAMAYYDVPLTLIVVLFSAVNVAVLKWVSRQRVDSNRRLAQEYGKVSGTAIAGLQNIETLKASGIESDFFARWVGYYTKAINAQQELELVNRAVGLLPSLLSSLTAASLLVLGGWRVINGNLTIGQLVAFQLLMVSFQRPVNSLVRFGSTLQTLQGNLERLDDILNNPVDSQLGESPPASEGDRPRPKSAKSKGAKSKGAAGVLDEKRKASPCPLPSATAPGPKLAGFLALKQLTYGYSPLDPPLIEEFDLTVQPGQRVALVGGSGSGKSTVAKLVAGLYVPWSGEVCFDGVPRDRIPRDVLTNSISVVEQEILLFAGSIRDNLTLWDTTVSEAALRQACQDADIEEVILSVPGGYDAMLLEGASNLSGGQRQRLEIARALVTDPTVLIMDEATSALDTETEKRIDQNLRRRGCTCLIVAHRLSTIRDCDEIIVLERGKVVQRGTHESLWEEGGQYARLLNSGAA